MEPDYIDHNGERISADSLRAKLSHESQREVDKRMASWFSTSSELGAFDEDAVKEAYRGAR